MSQQVTHYSRAALLRLNKFTHVPTFSSTSRATDQTSAQSISPTALGVIKRQLDASRAAKGSQKRPLKKVKIFDEQKTVPLEEQKREKDLGGLAFEEPLLLYLLSFLDLNNLIRMLSVNKHNLYHTVVYAIAQKMKLPYNSQEKHSDKCVLACVKLLKISQMTREYAASHAEELKKELIAVSFRWIVDKESDITHIFFKHFPCFLDLNEITLETAHQKCREGSYLHIAFRQLLQLKRAKVRNDSLASRLPVADIFDNLRSTLRDQQIAGGVCELNELLNEDQWEKDVKHQMGALKSCYGYFRKIEHTFLGNDNPAIPSMAKPQQLFALFKLCVEKINLNRNDIEQPYYPLLYGIGMLLLQREYEGKVSEKLQTKISRFVRTTLRGKLQKMGNEQLLFMAKKLREKDKPFLTV